MSFKEAKAEVISRFEKDYIKRLLHTHQGNITKAAQAAQKKKSCTNKITLMQDWVFRLGLLCIS